MKLKLFSDEEVSGALVNDLQKLFKLTPDRIKLLIETVVGFSMNKATSTEIFSKLGVKEDDFHSIVNATQTVASRILSGKNGEDVIEDLITNKFPAEPVKALFAELDKLPAKEHNSLRVWSFEVQINRPHWHSLASLVDTRSVVDGGNLIGMLPLSYLRFSVQPEMEEFTEGEESIPEVKWVLESSASELDRMISALQAVKAELDTATENLRKRFGDAIVTN